MINKDNYAYCLVCDFLQQIPPKLNKFFSSASSTAREEFLLNKKGKNKKFKEKKCNHKLIIMSSHNKYCLTLRVKERRCHASS